MSDDTTALPFDDEENPFRAPDVTAPLQPQVRSGGLYPLAMPSELMVELGKVAHARGCTIAELVVKSIQRTIQEHKG